MTGRGYNAAPLAGNHWGQALAFKLKLSLYGDHIENLAGLNVVVNKYATQLLSSDPLEVLFGNVFAQRPNYAAVVIDVFHAVEFRTERRVPIVNLFMIAFEPREPTGRVLMRRQVRVELVTMDAQANAVSQQVASSFVLARNEVMGVQRAALSANGALPTPVVFHGPRPQCVGDVRESALRRKSAG